MARGTLNEASMELSDTGHFERPDSSQLFPHTAGSSRASVLSSVVPYLRRLDVNDDMQAHQKFPLLTLKLSSPLFLDSVVIDELTKEPLYLIRTVETLTTIRRADPWEGNTKTADIYWPKSVPAKGKGISDGVLIQMRGARWKDGETLLRRSTIRSAPRKFNIPNFSHSLKWRRAGTSYLCTTAGVKGPIAILDPSIESLPPRLKVFETLHDKYSARPMLVHRGVSLLLLDYLIVTALLLVTDIQDWMLVKKFDGNDTDTLAPDNDTSSPNSTPGTTSTSNMQWRKIMFGEPIYPKRSSQSSIISQRTTPDVAPPNLTTSDQLAKIVYGDPIYPTLRASESDTSTSESDEEDNRMLFSSSRTRSPSPSAESIFYPLTPSSAPSHTYLDPCFYSEHNIPPVPPIPARYGTPGAGSSRGNHIRPSSSHSTASMRRLPDVPPIPPLIPRPRSTPPQAMSSPITNQELSFTSGTHHSMSATRRLPEPGTSQPLRQLPLPPPLDQSGRSPYSLGHGPPIARARSHSVHSKEKWYGQRALPAPPTSSSAGRIHPIETRESRRLIVKETEDDLVTHWVHALTNPQQYSISIPTATFDTPPPAYNTIDFRSRVDLSTMPSLPHQIPLSLSSDTGVNQH